MSDTAASTGLVKATFYLREDDVLRLEELRLARRRRGQKVDKSALIREAIELLNRMEGSVTNAAH